MPRGGMEAWYPPTPSGLFQSHALYKTLLRVKYNTLLSSDLL